MMNVYLLMKKSVVVVVERDVSLILLNVMMNEIVPLMMMTNETFDFVLDWILYVEEGSYTDQ